MPELANGIYLAFDFGTKKIGLAVGSSLNKSPKPLLVSIVGKNGINWQDIDTAINTWHPVGLVVGLPLNQDETHSETSLKAMAFSEELSLRYKLDVYYSNEMLTSFCARSIQRENKQLQRKSAATDAIAAALILENWFGENF